ncbi:MAG: ribonuclease III [Deltaproteobacteria bacterium]|nr:ribonuclease III [Deltaproteobacteria bacterium]MBW2360413.1 ribonuclease III [Deltaproteobacteria bacterium]
MSDLDALLQRLGHRFADAGLLDTALVHASLAGEIGEGRGNERLEFLGDAVLDLVVAELLYEAHPDWDEGTLSRARAALVKKDALAERARTLDLGAFIRLGRSEQRGGGAEKDSILADCFEAVLGALYLDGGLAPVRALTKHLFGDALREGPQKDPKTQFQEWANATSQEYPRYETRGDTGVQADERRFTVAVTLAGRVWGTGVGRSKRVAEREAAHEALRAAESADD